MRARAANFGRLDFEWSDRKPALRAERDMAEMGEHGQQRQDDEAVDDIGRLLEPVIIDQRHHCHYYEADREPDQLALQVELRIDSDRGQLDTRRRVHHDGADKREHDGACDQDEVATAHEIPGRVTLPAIAPPSGHARRVGGHDGQG